MSGHSSFHSSRRIRTRIEEYPKDEFPTAQVYPPVDRPVLRLITCGGQYDAERDTYAANVIAYGTLVTTRT